MVNLLKETLSTQNGTIGIVKKNLEPVIAFYRTHSNENEDYQAVYTSNADKQSLIQPQELINAINHPFYEITDNGIIAAIDTSIPSFGITEKERDNKKQEILKSLTELLSNSPGQFFIYGDLKSNYSDFGLVHAKDGVITCSSCGPDVYADGFKSYLVDSTGESEGEDYLVHGSLDGDSLKIITIIE